MMSNISKFQMQDPPLFSRSCLSHPNPSPENFIYKGRQLAGLVCQFGFYLRHYLLDC